MGRWTKETFKDYWRSKDAYSYWNNEWVINEDSYLEEFKVVLSALKRIKWNSLLELGCGCGKNLREIRKNFKGKKVFGFDINESFLEEARKHKLVVRNIDSESLKLKKPVDVILCYEHLQHLHPETLKEVVTKITGNSSHVIIYEGYNGKDNDVIKSGRGGRWSYDYTKHFPLVLHKEIDTEKNYMLLLSDLL